MLSVFLSVLETAEDKSFFEQIYIKYRTNLIRYAISLLLNQWDAEDVVEDVFASVIRVGTSKIMSLEDETYVSNYLSAAVRNRSYSKLKRDTERAEVPLENAERLAAPLHTEDPAAINEYQLLKNTIAELPQLYADILMFSLVYELTAGQIAELFGLTPAAVRKRLERGKEVLRKKLGEEYL